MSWITGTKHGVVLQIHAVPRAQRTALQGLHGDAIKIRLQAPPQEGQANKVLLQFLSKILGISQGQIRLLTGASHRKKRILISGLPADTIRAKLDL